MLELGTGTGVATSWLLDGMDPQSTLISVDVDPAVQQVAADAFRGDPRLHLILQDGVAFLETLEPAAFDLIFADAMPGKFESLDLALRTVKPGGFYVIDDLLPQPNWPAGHGPRVDQLLEDLATRTNFCMAPLDWATGVVILTRKH